jgi:hypothetical protein
MYFASDLNTEDLNLFNVVDHWNHTSEFDLNLESISIRFGAGSPYPSTPRSERQYEGYLQD